MGGNRFRTDVRQAPSWLWVVSTLVALSFVVLGVGALPGKPKPMPSAVAIVSMPPSVLRIDRSTRTKSNMVTQITQTSFVTDRKPPSRKDLNVDVKSLRSSKSLVDSEGDQQRDDFRAVEGSSLVGWYRLKYGVHDPRVIFSDAAFIKDLCRFHYFVACA